MIYALAILIAVVIVGFVGLFVWQRKYFAQIQDKLTNTLIEVSKENQKQIEHAKESSVELLKATEQLKGTLKDELYERFKDIGEKFDNISIKISSALFEQAKKNTDELDKFMQLVEEKLVMISDKVDERLKVGFENVDKTFKDIIEGIARISEAQRKIEELSSEVVSLQKILDDKKRRGGFGEVRLELILESVFGESRELYDIQVKLKKNGKEYIADAIIKAPQVGLIAIDSKFPLENYQRMINAEGNEYREFKRAFENDLKKHIDDIADKYIIKGTTADMAVMFLPAEAIFATVNAHHSDIVAYAYSRRVWIASPTTLMALLTTISAAVRDMKIHQQAKNIQNELMKLSEEFDRYRKRWEKLLKDVDRLHKDAADIDTTTQKIVKAFERIEKVEFEEVKSIKDGTD
ncbi:DNA recombination protein RmuC [Hippea alviniae]|uniref:DNA recombination protein RmuC n=1 Tax=Hippea alviniae TaxID=1279027 RepID=UPI0003B6F8A0|nr:DNA recombination protein RmuC [Hippea alviniae]